MTQYFAFPDFHSPDRFPQLESALPDHTCKEEEQFKKIEADISALSDQERNDLYILFLISDREGWSLWTTNKEMGYFLPDHPLIEAIDRASRSAAQWLHFFYVFGGKSVEEDVIASA